MDFPKHINREPITRVDANIPTTKFEVTNQGIYASKIFNDVSKFYGVPGANAGKKNGMYKHGRWSEDNKPPKNKCAKCGSTKNLLYHHKDHDETNNAPSNLVVWCKKCHANHHERGKNFHGKKSKNRSKKKVKNGKKSR